MELQVPHRICNGIFNHTLLCEFHQGKLLLHLTIPFEEKPKTNLPSDNLKYYRQRKQMTTRQLAEKMDIVPSTVVMYENGKHPIPYNVAIKLADVLEIEASLLYDDFSRFLSVPYTEALKSVRTALGLSQKAFAERIGLVPSYRSSSEDFIGRFYGEFMRYSGGDGQTLGIVLTPRHICDLFCDLLNIQTTDIVLDPCCGTAGFLVAAMHHMLEKAGTDQNKRKNIKKKQLHGFELQSNMFAIAATNMILRDDGNSNIKCEDFLRQNPAQVQLKGATVGMMNPPYSQGTKSDPSQYELSFVEHLLDSLTEGARAAVIVPQSSMTGKTKDEQTFKENILKHHTLEGVITCNTDTFYGVGTNPVIAIFTAHEPHPEDKVCKFIDFRDDGYEVRAHIGLVEGDSAKDKRQHLLDVWFGRTEAASKFCVESTVKAEDEWLHSFFYFNDEIPADADFEKAIGDYLTFEFSMIMQNREYLFGQGGEENAEP